MPKAPMDDAEILEKKEKIVDIAAEIIMDDGYHSLSMRKIGLKLGMTAANLYNYYSNKDELNIAIRTRAGKILFTALEAAYHSGNVIAEKINFMIDAYIRFGIVNANYYTILLDMPTPKFADYVGSPLEALAREEKDSTEKSIGLLRTCILNLEAEGFVLPDNKDLFIIMLWSQLHGLVSLYNNKLISEIHQNPERAIEEAKGLASEIIFNFIDKPANRNGYRA
jgi:AcrR family transcriptional regulator